MTVGHYTIGSAAHSPVPVTLSDTLPNVLLRPLSVVSPLVYIIYYGPIHIHYCMHTVYS